MYRYVRRYTGPLIAAILDWSGTTADKYVIAPAVVSQKVFEKFNVSFVASIPLVSLFFNSFSTMRNRCVVLPVPGGPNIISLIKMVSFLLSLAPQKIFLLFLYMESTT